MSFFTRLVANLSGVRNHRPGGDPTVGNNQHEPDIPADPEPYAEQPNAAELHMNTMLNWLDWSLQNYDDHGIRIVGRVLAWDPLWTTIHVHPRYLALLMRPDTGHQMAVMQHAALEAYGAKLRETAQVLLNETDRLWEMIPQ